MLTTRHLTKREFKRLWEKKNDPVGITWDEVADCAKRWGLYDAPRCHAMSVVLDAVLEAAGVEPGKR